MVRWLRLAALLATSCQISFDLPASGGGAGATSAAGGKASSEGGDGGNPALGGAAGNGGSPAPLLLQPIALWTFPGNGRPEIVKDRVGQVDLFPYPVAPADGAVKVENSALVLASGNLKSDPDPGTALVRPLALSKEFSLEIWAEMGPTSFEGKRYLFKATGSDLFNFNQFTTGAAFEVPITSTMDGGVFVGDHRGQIRHWLGTFSGTNRLVRLFVDGDLASSRSLDGPIEFADKESRVEIGDQLWEGRVFLAALYDRSLLPADVRLLHEAGWQR